MVETSIPKLKDHRHGWSFSCHGLSQQAKYTNTIYSIMTELLCVLNLGKEFAWRKHVLDIAKLIVLTAWNFLFLLVSNSRHTEAKRTVVLDMPRFTSSVQVSEQMTAEISHVEAQVQRTKAHYNNNRRKLAIGLGTLALADRRYAYSYKGALAPHNKAMLRASSEICIHRKWSVPISK